MTKLLRQEIVQHVRELSDEAILDLVRGRLGLVSDRSDTSRRRPRAPEAPIAGELAALRGSVEAAVERFDRAASIDVTALALAREQIVRLTERLNLEGKALAERERDVGQVRAHAALQDLQLLAAAHGRKTLTEEKHALLGRAEAAEEQAALLIIERDQVTAELVTVREQLRKMTEEHRFQLSRCDIAHAMHDMIRKRLRACGVTVDGVELHHAVDAACASWLKESRELAEEIKVVKGQNADLALELQAVKTKAVELVRARDEVIAGLEVLTADQRARAETAERIAEERRVELFTVSEEEVAHLKARAAPGNDAALTMAEFWARAWKSLAREMKGRWLFAKDQVVRLQKPTPRANLVVPTDFDAREKRRIQSGHFERAAARADATVEAVEADEDGEPIDEAEEDDGMREPVKSGVRSGRAGLREVKVNAKAPEKKPRRGGFAGKKHMFGGELLTVAEIASRRKVTVTAVHKWIARGTLDAMVTGTGVRGPTRRKASPS